MIDSIHAAGLQRKVPFKKYKKARLRMLQKEFCIKLEPEELAHYETLDTETKVDQFYVAMLNKYWR